MGIYRTYFSKNNTIIKNSSVNTGNNPIAELAFGNGLTRFIFTVDLSVLKSKIDQKEVILNENTKHYVKIKSTREFSVNPYLNEFGKITLDNSRYPTSFDLELHPVLQSWDEGVGYDFIPDEKVGIEPTSYVNGVSNWLMATSLENWDAPGALVSGSTAIATQHFDAGSEDIMMDITDYVNSLITTGSTTLSLCLKYADEFEELVGDGFVTGFFTRHTQTFFEPFVETSFDEVIKDDRDKFYLNKVNRLYLYVNVSGKLTNLDELPVCTITGVSGLTVNHQSKGIYYVELLGDDTKFISYKKYSDVWSNLKVNGRNLGNVKMDFIPKDSSEYYQLTDDISPSTRYGLSISGIKHEEKIMSGEMRRVNVLVRKPYTVNDTDIIDDAFYRIYVKIGPAQLTIIDFSPISRSNYSNFFNLDTSWLIPNKYYIDIMIKQNGENLLYNEGLVFNVISRKKM